MNSTSFLLGILPLLIFVIVDSFCGLKAALITAFLAAVAELGASLYYFGEIDFVTGFSFILVFVMCLLSYYKNSPLFFKLQPVILGIFLGGALIISYYLDRPLLYLMFTKYQNQMPGNIQSQIENPFFQELLKLGTNTIGWSLLVHAGLIAYSAFKMSKWWWIAIRGIGFYVFSFLGIFLAVMWLKNHS